MAVKKKAAKKTAAKKTAVAVKKPATKTEVMAYLSDQTGLTKRDVSSVFDALGTMIQRDLKKNGPGVFNMPGLMKIKVVRKPATRARKGINPFTGEQMVFKAKPAHNVVKVLPLKGLKDMV